MSAIKRLNRKVKQLQDEQAVPATKSAYRENLSRTPFNDRLRLLDLMVESGKRSGKIVAMILALRPVVIPDEK